METEKSLILQECVGPLFCLFFQEGFQAGVAVDVGCGTGQSTFPLTEHFDKVYGIDPSKAQVY